MRSTLFLTVILPAFLLVVIQSTQANYLPEEVRVRKGRPTRHGLLVPIEGHALQHEQQQHHNMWQDQNHDHNHDHNHDNEQEAEEQHDQFAHHAPHSDSEVSDTQIEVGPDTDDNNNDDSDQEDGGGHINFPTDSDDNAHSHSNDNSDQDSGEDNESEASGEWSYPVDSEEYQQILNEINTLSLRQQRQQQRNVGSSSFSASRRRRQAAQREAEQRAGGRWVYNRHGVPTFIPLPEAYNSE